MDKDAGSKKKALITGITGQDGSYLAEFLLEKGYEVHGLIRRMASESQRERFSRISHLTEAEKIVVHYGDVTDYPTMWRLVGKIKPAEIYHLASQSNAVVSLEDDFGAFSVNTASTHYILSAIKELSPKTRFFFAGSAEMFGPAKHAPQDETTPFRPNSPYGIAKIAGFELTRMFRERYGVFATGGILFGHESPRRGFDFLTRKVTRTVARIKAGLEDKLALGNLETKKDWGFSGDYVEAMWKMLQAEEPEDFVIGTGETHMVKEFVEKAFATLDLDWEKYVVKDPRFFRPTPPVDIVANPKKANEVLGWKSKTSFDELVGMMVKHDMENIEEGTT